jgi:hypothetical protein
VTVADNDLVRIEAGGRLEILGEAAALRLQAREGLFHLLPSPPQLVVMREHAPAPPAAKQRVWRLSGEIASPGAICDIIGFLDQAAWKGELIVFEGPGTRSLFFDQGHIVGASSTLPEERIGQTLFRYGVLTREQIHATLDATATTSLRFGEAAVKLGFLQREKLFEWIQRQSEEIVYGSMRVEHGVFYFLDSFDESALSSRQPLAIAALIREGVRRMHETRFFRARVPSPLHVPVRVPDRTPGQPDQSTVYAAVDGTRAITDICRLLGESEFIVTRTIFHLVQRGFVTIQPPHVEPEGIVETCNRAVSLILRELDAMDQGDDVRAQLARFAEKGVYAQLLQGARQSDGTLLDAHAVAGNAARIEPTPQLVQQLTHWLREYTAYALFLARPHLQKAHKGNSPELGENLSQRVAAMFASIMDEAGPRQ